MKVLCPHCERLVTLERFRVDGGALVVTCLKCNQETRVDPRADLVIDAAPSFDASPPPRASVPSPQTSQKALSLASSPAASNVVALRTGPMEAIEKARKDTTPFDAPDGHCPKCVSKRSVDATSCAVCGLVFAQLSPEALPPAEWLQRAWRALLVDWGNEAAHDKVRLEALAKQDLVALGRLYRIRLADMPDDPWALRAREELVRVASAPIAARPAPNTQAAERVKVVAAVVIAAFAIVAVLVLMRTMMLAND